MVAHGRFFCPKILSALLNGPMTQLSVMYRGLLGFGGYPTPMFDERKKQKGQLQISDHLRNFKVFVDLTENTVGYIVPEGAQYISYPVPDSGVPEKKETFKNFLFKAQEALEKGMPMYIHCEHGRGRTGVVMVCLISLLYGISYEEAVEQVNAKFHESCPPGSSWKEKTIPCHANQREFCRKFIAYSMVSAKPSKVAEEQILCCWKNEDIKNAVDEIGNSPLLLEIIASGEELFGFCVKASGKLYIFHLHDLHKQKLVSGVILAILGSDIPKIGYIAQRLEVAKHYGYEIRNFIDIEQLGTFSTAVDVPPILERSPSAWAKTPLSGAEIEVSLDSINRLEELVKSLVVQDAKKPEIGKEDVQKIKMLQLKKAKAELFNSKTFASIPLAEREKYISTALEKACASGLIRVDSDIVVACQ